MPSSQRLTSRQSDAQDRRRHATQRQRNFTNQIRKKKKSEYLAQKRNLPPLTTANHAAVSSSGSSMPPIVRDFCIDPTMEKLEIFSETLRSTPQTGDIHEAEELALATEFLEKLKGAASSSPGEMSMALNILVQVTATSSSDKGGDTDYYGSAPMNWSTLISQNTAWLTLLVNLAPRMEAACVVLGNLVGEASPQVFRELRQAGMVPALVAAIRQPAAAWALTNAIRHDTTEWATTYCSEEALSATLLQQLLLEPLLASQAAWMLASLTEREDAVLEYLMGHEGFIPALLQCIEHPVATDQVLPLVQALANFSYPSQNGSCTTKLLTTTPNLPQTVARLLQDHNDRALLAQAAWLAEGLLHGSGLPGHPSTTIAAPVLIPALFHELQNDTPHPLDSQQELVFSLWTALREPTPSGSATFAPILPDQELIRSTLPTLVHLVSSRDVGAALAAVSVIQILLNQDGSHDSWLAIALEEHDVASALEAVCESPNEEAANVAADLLDDYFYHNLDNNAMADVAEDSPSGGMVPPRSSGLGRGRGTTLPSWMTQGRA